MTEYALSTWIVHRQPVAEAIRLLSDTGFRTVELSGSESPVLDLLERDPEALRQRLSADGLHAVSVHSPEAGRRLDADDLDEREASLAANRRYLDLARRCGAGVLVLHPTSGKGRTGDENRAAWKRVARESLKRLAQIAAPTGVRLAVENLIAIKRKRDRPGATCVELLEMIDGLGDHVGLCLDIGHSVISGLDPASELRDAGDKLFGLHLHDVEAAGKDHFVPGEGVIDWGTFLPALDNAPADAVRTIEVSPPDSNLEGRLEDVAAVVRGWQRR